MSDSSGLHVIDGLMVVGDEPTEITGAMTNESSEGIDATYCQASVVR